MTNNDPVANESNLKDELKAFLFITVILFPMISVIIICGYGFFIWLAQALGLLLASTSTGG